MSLFRQLWLAVIASTIIAFAGSLIVSMVTARQYLEQQLAIKNNDNAASLALSMSQLAKDPITIELQVAAVFDSGQYATVQVIDPEGKVMIERSSPPDAGNVPDWFMRVFPIESHLGQAQVSTGWTQFGTATDQPQTVCLSGVVEWRDQADPLVPRRWWHHGLARHEASASHQAAFGCRC